MHFLYNNVSTICLNKQGWNDIFRAHFISVFSTKVFSHFTEFIRLHKLQVHYQSDRCDRSAQLKPADRLSIIYICVIISNPLQFINRFLNFLYVSLLVSLQTSKQQQQTKKLYDTELELECCLSTGRKILQTLKIIMAQKSLSFPSLATTFQNYNIFSDFFHPFFYHFCMNNNNTY